jgi:regulatory protein
MSCGLRGEACAELARRESPTVARERRGAIDDPEVVLNAALRFLEVRSRSVAEVRRRLAQAGYRDELINGAIDRLLELGVLDDETFARLWLESRDRARPRGERALRQELAQKGVERRLVDRLLDERKAEDGAEERDVTAALSLLERQRRSLDRETDPRRRRHKAYALLARNGFDAETCGDAIRRWDSGGDGLP